MSTMARVRDDVYRGYRDAVGALMAARRGDDEGYALIRSFSPALTTHEADALIAIAAGLMRELEKAGGDPDQVVTAWALNLARKEFRA